MGTQKQRATNAELRLLDELWAGGAKTVRQLAVTLYTDPTSVQYRTVQVQLDRLERKQLVRVDRTVTPHGFDAAVDRASFLAEELQSMADRVCDGSLAPLVLNLAGKAKLTEHEKRELRKLLEGE